LTGILVCRRSTGFIDTLGCHRHSSRAKSSSELKAPQTVRRRASALHPQQEPATEPLRKLTERLQDAHLRAFGPSTESLRALTECLRALTGTSGFHRTPPGVHRRTPPSRTGLSRPNRTTRGSADDSGRPSGCARQRASSDTRRNLRVPPGPLRRPNEARLSILAVLRR
jgi:hypothetical protein